MSKNVQRKEKIFISGLLFDKYFERFPRSFQGRATHSHGRLIGNYKNLWHMGHLERDGHNTGHSQLVRVPKYLLRISAIFSGSTSPSRAV